MLFRSRNLWRVAYAAEHKFLVNVAEMRHEEGMLFGHAWLDDDTFERDGKTIKTAARKSLVRVRLELPSASRGQAWGTGTQQGVAPLKDGLDTSYAWFGLIKRGNGQPNRNAIKAAMPSDNKSGESTRVLKLAVPTEHSAAIEQAMRLIHAFGQLGSRSRGGWGSVQVDGMNALDAEAMRRYAQPMAACLKRDWAMTLASDAGGLCVWQSQQGYDSWDKAMRAVAGERKRVRTALKSISGKDLRAALGFATPGRMPSPLRWKIIARADGTLGVRIFAMPHDLPADSKKTMPVADLAVAWTAVIRAINASTVLHRFSAGNQS